MTPAIGTVRYLRKQLGYRDVARPAANPLAIR
jgi:hypothetical protein